MKPLVVSMTMWMSIITIESVDCDNSTAQLGEITAEVASPATVTES